MRIAEYTSGGSAHYQGERGVLARNQSGISAFSDLIGKQSTCLVSIGTRVHLGTDVVRGSLFGIRTAIG